MTKCFLALMYTSQTAPRRSCFSALSVACYSPHSRVLVVNSRGGRDLDGGASDLSVRNWVGRGGEGDG